MPNIEYCHRESVSDKCKSKQKEHSFCQVFLSLKSDMSRLYGIDYTPFPPHNKPDVQIAEKEAIKREIQAKRFM